MRFPNVKTGKMQWFTVGYLPIIPAKSKDPAEAARLRLVRDRVLQRCMAVLLDAFIPVSEHGVVFDIPGVGPMLAVPRVILYAANQPEERHLLGLKLYGCAFPCSHCMVDSAHAGGPRAGESPHEVIDMLDLHLEAAKLSEEGGNAARLAQISDEAFVLPIVPALAAVHGLGTGRCSLYAIFGFDLLHVRVLVALCMEGLGTGGRVVLLVAPLLFVGLWGLGEPLGTAACPRESMLTCLRLLFVLWPESLTPSVGVPSGHETGSAHELCGQDDGIADKAVQGGAGAVRHGEKHHRCYQ